MTRRLALDQLDLIPRSALLAASASRSCPASEPTLLLQRWVHHSTRVVVGKHLGATFAYLAYLDNHHRFRGRRVSDCVHECTETLFARPDRGTATRAPTLASVRTARRK